MFDINAASAERYDQGRNIVFIMRLEVQQLACVCPHLETAGRDGAGRRVRSDLGKKRSCSALVLVAKDSMSLGDNLHL